MDMAQIASLAPTTELEAVNAMLAIIGEAPVTVLAGATQADVVTAIAILRERTREVLSMGWRFNTEFGFEIAPADTLDWDDTGGIITPLNIFTPPAGLVGFAITELSEQQGAKYVDTVLRKSRVYLSADLIPVPVLVFYDRAHNRDGFPQADRSFLYINPVWFVDFEDLPEQARRYCTIKAARAFQRSVVGSDTLNSFTAADEAFALRILRREFGVQDDYNIFNNAGTFKHLGQRRLGAAGVFEDRKNRGPA